MKYLGVNGIVISHGTGSIVSGGTFTISSPSPSTKNKASSNGVYFGPISFTFSGGNAAGCDPTTVAGAGTINPGSTKVRDVLTSLFAMLEGDTGSGTFAGTSGGTPVPLGVQPVKVSSASQSKVQGN